MPVHPVEFDVPPRLRDWVSSNVGAIGINGLDGAGKTTFALGVQGFLADQNLEARLLHVDDFNNDAGAFHPRRRASAWLRERA